MNESLLDNFFHGASRIVFVFPLIIVVLGLIIKFNNPGNKKTNAIISRIEIKPSTKPQISPTLSVQLNLNGPFICTGSAVLSKEKKEQITYDISIFNKQLYAKFNDKEVTQYVLFVNDCVYRWKKGIFTGVKTCGLSSYVNILEVALSFSTDQSLQLIKQIIPIEVSMSEIIRTCKEETIKDQSIFSIPQNILFKNGEL